MDKKTKKEIVIFFAAIGAIVVTFAAGVLYLRAETKKATPVVATTTSVAASTSTSSTTIIAAVTQTNTSTAPTSTVTVTSTPVVATNTPTSTVVKTPPSPPAPPAPPAPPKIIVSAGSSAVAPATLPYSIGTLSNTFGPGDGWGDWWGAVSQSSSVITINAKPSGTGGGILFPASDAWTDYTFQAVLDWNAGETFGLMARYQNDNNYLLCNFDEQNVGTIHMILEQYVNGVRTELADGNVSNYNQAGGVNISAAIQVDGDQASCGFNYHAISTTVAGDNVSPALLKGGIGFTTWNPTVGKGQIVVKSVGVSTSSYYLGPDSGQGIYF